jgi:tetratricopeptide (TPR) repeat protein
MMLLLRALALVSAQPETPPFIKVTNDNGVTGTIESNSSAESAKVDEAYLLMKSGKLAEAIAIFDSIIAQMEAKYANEKRQIFAARSMTETILYAGLAGTQKKDAIVLNDAWATAYFLKGFALIDLNRRDDAKPLFDKALGLSPMNAQFLAERGEWFKNRKEWSSAFADFEAASTAAEFSPDDVKKSEKARALRGMGFVRIEQGELKEAEKLFRQSLKLQPGNSSALSELEYIKSLKSN